MYYLIVCRSLTYAQRAKRTLERAGLSAGIVRTPQHIAQGGCGHAVKVAAHRGEAALAVLKRAGLPFSRVYVTSGAGDYREVPE